MLADYLSQPRCVVSVNRRDNRLPFPHFVAGPQRHAGGLIPAGTFQVRVVNLPAGFKQTQPANGAAYTVTTVLGSGNAANVRLFDSSNF